MKTLFKRNIRPLKQRSKRYISFTIPISKRIWDKIFPDAIQFKPRNLGILREFSIIRVARKSVAEPEALDYLFGGLWDITQVADTAAFVQDIKFTLEIHTRSEWQTEEDPARRHEVIENSIRHTRSFFCRVKFEQVRTVWTF